MSQEDIVIASEPGATEESLEGAAAGGEVLLDSYSSVDDEI